MLRKLANHMVGVDLGRCVEEFYWLCVSCRSLLGTEMNLRSVDVPIRNRLWLFFIQFRSFTDWANVLGWFNIDQVWRKVVIPPPPPSESGALKTNRAKYVISWAHISFCIINDIPALCRWTRWRLRTSSVINYWQGGAREVRVCSVLVVLLLAYSMK